MLDIEEVKLLMTTDESYVSDSKEEISCPVTPKAKCMKQKKWTSLHDKLMILISSCSSLHKLDS